MTETTKPVECFARIYPSGAITGACSMSKTSTPSIRMIEHSAYLAALEELERLRRELWHLKEADGRPYDGGNVAEKQSE